MLIWCVFFVLLVIVGVNDFLFFRIENEYVLSLIALYVLSCAFGVSGSNFPYTFAWTAMMFGVTFVLNQFNLIGGGDVKLLVPLMLFAENNWETFVIATAISGCGISLLYVCFPEYIFELRSKLIELIRKFKSKKIKALRIALLSSYRIKAKLVRHDNVSVLKREIPYGVALACGSLYVVLDMMFR